MEPPISRAILKSYPIFMRKRKMWIIHFQKGINLMGIQLIVTAIFRSQSNLRKISNLRREYYQRALMIYHQFIETAIPKNLYPNLAPY